MIRHGALNTSCRIHENKTTVVIICDQVWHWISRNYSMWKSLEWLHEHKCTNMLTRRGLISIYRCNPPHDHLSPQTCVSIKTRLDPDWGFCWQLHCWICVRMPWHPLYKHTEASLVSDVKHTARVQKKTVGSGSWNIRRQTDKGPQICFS